MRSGRDAVSWLPERGAGAEAGSGDALVESGGTQRTWGLR